MVEPYPAAAGLRRRQARAEAEGLVAMPPQPRPPPPPPAVVVPPAQQQQQQQRRPSWRFSHIYCFVSFLIALVAIVGAPIREKSTNTSSVSSTTTTTSSFRHVFGSLKDATTTNTDDSLWMGGDTSGGSNNGGGGDSSSSSTTTTTDATLSESGSSTTTTTTTTTSNNLAPLWPNTATAPFFHWFDDFIMSDYFVFYNDGQKQQQQQQKEEELKKAKLLQKQKEQQQQQQQVPAWIRWALPPPKQQQQQQQQPPIQKQQQQQQQKKSFSEYIQHFFHQQWLKIKPFLDPNIFHPQVGWTSVVDKILTSTPRLLLITNWLLSVTYLVHYAVARMFLGTSATTNNNNGGPNNNNNATDTPPPNKGGFLLFKLLLISAVIGPDTLDWLILLCWYTLLSFLKSLASLARQTLERQTAATTIQERRGVLQLLLWVLAWDILSAASCVGLFYQAGWDMVLLLTSDCVLLGLETCSSCMLHVHQSLVTNHERQVQQVEEEILAIHQRAREEATTRTSAAAAAATAAAAAAAMTTEATQWEEAAAAGADDDDDDEGVVVDQVMEDLNEDDDDDDGIVVDNDHSSHGDNSVTGGGDGQEASSPGTQQQQQQQPPPYIPDPSLTTDLEQQLESMELLHYKRVGILESVVFWLELSNHVITILHFCHVWKLHSLQFTLIDGVLLIHLHSAVSNAMKKIAQRRNYLRIARDLDGLFQDANDVDMKKAGDLCCICLGSMTTSGSVKKVGCGHVFHTHCLREVVERARSIETAQCPLCRARVLDGSSPNNTNNGAGTQAGGGGGATGATNNNNNNNNTRGLGGTATTGGGNNNNNDDNNNNNNNNEDNNNGGTAAPAVEHSLFRFSTEGLLPFLPAFSFEVVRRPAAGEQQQQDNNNGENNNNNNGPTATNQNNNHAGQQQQQQQQSLLQQVLWSLAAAGGGNTTTALHHQQLSPEQEANALNGLVDMFPQYDRSDLLRELRRRNGSGEAVVESILIGTFRGEARGRSNGAGIGGMTMMRQQQQQQ